MNFKKQLREGLLTNNPVVGQLLGMCSTMAITTTLFNGLGMGLSVTLILICSNVVISMLRKVIPDKIRIAAYIVVIAGFVTIIDLLLQAYLPALSESLGVFIPLIVVNCIILGRAEAFASKNGVLASAVDGLTQGIGYTVALVCMCVIRELLGSGTFGKGVLSADGVRILPSQYPAMLMILPVGGFHAGLPHRLHAVVQPPSGREGRQEGGGSKMSVFISLFTIALNAILAENFILVKFMGICPFMGVSKKQDTALGMGIAVTFVMGIASAATWAVNEFLLVPLNLVYMQTVVFILVIAALVQLVEMFLQKAVPALYQALGIYLPLITTNCAVLGVALLNIQDGYNFVESLVYGITGGIGFTVAILLFSSVRERLEDCDCPKAFRGFPIALLAAGLLALSFMGFSGFKVFG